MTVQNKGGHANKGSLYLLHDNSRPHTANSTKQLVNSRLRCYEPVKKLWKNFFEKASRNEPPFIISIEIVATLLKYNICTNVTNKFKINTMLLMLLDNRVIHKEFSPPKTVKEQFCAEVLCRLRKGVNLVRLDAATLW